MISLNKMILRSTLFAMTVMLVTPLQVMASRDQWIHQRTSRTDESGCNFSFFESWKYNNVPINGTEYFVHISVCNNNRQITHVTLDNTNLHYFPHQNGRFDQNNVPADLRQLLREAWDDFTEVPECRPTQGCHDEL